MRSLAIALVLFLVLGGCDARRDGAGDAAAGAWTDYGLQVQDLPESARSALGVSHGVMVIRVRAPADRTRILPGDVIVSVDQVEVRSAEEFGRLAERWRGVVGVVVRRSDADLFITLPTPDAPPASPGPSSNPRGTPQRT